MGSPIAVKNNKYYDLVQPRLDLIHKLASRGVKEKNIAQTLGIATSTFSEYKKKYSELSDTIKKARGSAVIALEDAVYEAATGGYKEIEEVVVLKEVTYDNGKRLKEEQRVEVVKKIIYQKPDTTAAIFLMTNWSDRYARDPKMMQLKKEELKFKKDKEEKGDW